jgi:type III restriction enzyme
LTRKAIDASSDAVGTAHVVIRDEVEQVVATQTAMPATPLRTAWSAG